MRIILKLYPIVQFCLSSVYGWTNYNVLVIIVLSSLVIVGSFLKSRIHLIYLPQQCIQMNVSNSLLKQEIYKAILC